LGPKAPAETAFLHRPDPVGWHRWLLGLNGRKARKTQKTIAAPDRLRPQRRGLDRDTLVPRDGKGRQLSIRVSRRIPRQPQPDLQAAIPRTTAPAEKSLQKRIEEIHPLRPS